MIDEVKEYQAELDKYQAVMTPYERIKYGEITQAARDKYAAPVTQGGLAYWEGAKNRLKSMDAAIMAEKRRIANTWDSGKLAAEMQLAEMRISKALKSDGGKFNLPAIEAIMAEAEVSGDKHKVRAVCEAVQDLVSKTPESAQTVHGQPMELKANRLALAAERKINEMNTTETLTKAVQERELASNDLKEAKEYLAKVGETMHTYAFEKELATVEYTKISDDTWGCVIIED